MRKVSWREENLGVTNVLAGEIACDIFGYESEVLILPEKLVLPRPDINKLIEIPKSKFLRYAFDIGEGMARVIFLNKLPEGLIRYRAFKMQM